jgi:hypothetical protein
VIALGVKNVMEQRLCWDSYCGTAGTVIETVAVIMP